MTEHLMPPTIAKQLLLTIAAIGLQLSISEIRPLNPAIVQTNGELQVSRHYSIPDRPMPQQTEGTGAR